jgi:hypothetical protein
MLDVVISRHLQIIKVWDREIDLSVKEGPMGYQLVGRVMAYQG